MNVDHRGVDRLRLVWLYPGSLDQALDKATWLEVTRQLRQSGWDVSLIAAGSAGVQSVDEVEVLCIARPDIYVLRQIVFHVHALVSLLRNMDAIDIVLFHQMSALWIMPLKFVRILLRKQNPLLVMDTRTVPMENKATLKDYLRAAYHNLMTRIANFWTDGQTAITPRMAAVARIPQTKLWGTWPSGVRLDEFIPVQGAHRWPVGVEAVRLVYIGTLNYERNLMTLCHAVERANAHGMNFVFTMVGNGTEYVALENYALRSRGTVRVLPTVPHDLIPGILAESHVGVLPFPNEKKYQVSSPIKLFEYMGAGLAILATHIVCHTDVAGDGEYVFWAQDGSRDALFEALCQLWQSRSSLAEMGREAAAAAREWTWQASALKLKAALECGLALNQHQAKATTDQAIRDERKYGGLL